jgi:O-antigen ligase
MKSKLQLVNLFAFGMASGLPFFDAWASSGHSLGNEKQVAAIVILLYTIIGSTFAKTVSWYRIKVPFSSYFFGFTFLTIISLIFNQGGSVGIAQVTTFVLIALIYYLLTQLYLHESTIKCLYIGLGLGFGACVLIATMQFLHISAFDMFKEEDLNANTSYTGDDGLELLRVWGPFGNALTFSFYLSVAAILLVGFTSYVWKSKFLAVIVAVMGLIGIAFTISRTALVGFILALAVAYYLTLNRAKRVFLAVSAVVLVIITVVFLPLMFANNPIVSRLSASNGDFKEGRLALWIVGYKAWIEQPLFGVGPGNLSLALYRNGWNWGTMDILTTQPGHVESFYLTLLFTFGIICFIVYIVFLSKLLRVALEVFHYRKEDKTLALGAPVFPTLICFIVNCTVNPALIFNFRIQLIMIFCMVIVGNTYKRLTEIKLGLQ